MLSHKHIMAIARMHDQYGPAEDSFSPRWHAENPGPGPDSLPAIQEGERTINVRIRRVLLPSGDVTLIQETDEALPKGASYVD